MQRPAKVPCLRQLIGKKIVSFRHDEFNFNNSSSQVVGIETELGMVYLYNFTEPLDYYGSVEDAAVWKLTKERYKFVDNKQLISSPVGEVVKCNYHGKEYVNLDLKSPSIPGTFQGKARKAELNRLTHFAMTYKKGTV